MELGREVQAEELGLWWWRSWGKDGWESVGEKRYIREWSMKL